MDTDFAHLAPVALVDATLKELGAVQTNDGRIEGGDDELVVSVAAAERFDGIPGK